MQEKQFELGGVTFGRDTEVEILGEGWTPGSAAIRTQDVDSPSGDGIRFGRDLRGSAAWAFSMYTNTDTEPEAWAALSRLAAAWSAEDVRTTPGAVTPLRYQIAGETRRVYGRPRRWTHSPNNLAMSGRIDIEADFATIDDLSYEDDEEVVNFDLLPPLETDAGLEVPFIAPFNTEAGASQRQSSVRIGGSVRTPIKITFEGPVTNPMVRIGDWAAGIVGTVPTGDPHTIDARPWVRAATRANGGSAKVSPRITRISQMWLPPGEHQVIFTGEDLSGTARALVSWRNAHRTPR